MDHRPPRPDQPYAWDDERLSAYLDGELSAPEQAQLEARLVVDPELRQLVDELRAVRQQLEILPEYRLKPTFADQVLRRAEQEMLLAPLGRESVEAVPAAAAPLAATKSPTAPAIPAQPVVTVSPARPTSRRWQRGAIWTAIAAAAVLLLIVTNRPNAPEQDHIARHDQPENAVVKASGAKNPTAPATAPTGDDKFAEQHRSMTVKGLEQEGLSKNAENQSQPFPFGQPAPSVTTVVGEVRDQNRAADASAATKPKQDAANSKDEANQLARSAAGDKPSANQPNAAAPQANPGRGNGFGGGGKNLLKSQGPPPRLATPEKQAAARREFLTPELNALLASEEFSRLASGGEGHVDRDEDQVVVVYMTPRDAAQGEKSFESLLASNSIGLAEKPLSSASEQQLQSSFAFTKPADRDVNPLGKPSSKDEQDAGLKDRKATTSGKPEQAENANNSPALRKETEAAPAADSVAKKASPTPVNELYYLEADATQVDELLRQLRSSSAQFSRLNVAPNTLRMAERNAKNTDEKSPAKKQAATMPQAGAFSDDARAEGMALAGNQKSGNPQYGNQPPGDVKQFAQGAVPAPESPAPVAPAKATPAAAPTSAAAPVVAAAPAAMPAAPAPAAPPGSALPTTPPPPTPAADPFAPAPFAPKEIAASSAPAAPAALSNAAPAETDGATALGDTKGGTNPSETEPSGNGTSARRAMQADKSLPSEARERAIAYRLRGVEALRSPRMPEPSAESAAGAGGGGPGTGLAMSANAEFGSAKSADLVKRGQEPAKPGDMRNQMMSEGGAQKLDAVTDPSNGDNAANEPATQEKKMEQPPLQGKAPAAPTQLPKPAAMQERQLARFKEAANAGESSLAESVALADAAALSSVKRSDPEQTESAKKSAPTPATKRVRVLFVIEHETP